MAASGTTIRSERRDAAVRALADRILALLPGRRVAVGIDGFDGAGKTVLADELAVALDGRREVLRVSIDGFHRPAAQRVARGRGPDTFYADSYDYPAFWSSVIRPFRAGEPVTPAVNDVVADERIEVAAVSVGEDTCLLVDGIFLQRPELREAWDAVVFVDVPFEVSVPRGNARFDRDQNPDPDAAVNQRYVGGQRLYLAEADPRARARWLFDNADLAAPRLVDGPR